MQPKIHFISFDATWVATMSELFSDISGITVTQGNIKSVPVENAVFVSPANSLGYMDGGIDYVLSREMFPGLQTRVQSLIRSEGVRNPFGRYYIPVGSAISLRIGGTPAHLIVAPTMFQPRDVSRTRNAYWSFLAALTLFHKSYGWGWGELTLVATSHCCGYGCMDSVESARQMHAAYMDFSSGVGARLDNEKKEYIVRFPSEEIDDGSKGFADADEVKEICIPL